MATMDIKVLRDMPGEMPRTSHKAGDVVTVKTHQGVPTSRFWRDRLKDSEIDQCCEIVKPKKSTSKTVGDK